MLSIFDFLPIRLSSLLPIDIASQFCASKILHLSCKSKISSSILAHFKEEPTTTTLLIHLVALGGLGSWGASCDASTHRHFDASMRRRVDASTRRRVDASTRQRVHVSTRQCIDPSTRRQIDASSLRRVDASTRRCVDEMTHRRVNASTGRH